MPTPLAALCCTKNAACARASWSQTLIMPKRLLIGVSARIDGDANTTTGNSARLEIMNMTNQRLIS